MGRLKLYSSEDLLAITSIRQGETKLGEKMKTLASIKQLPDSACRFVLIGLPEDVGIKANFGKQGSRNAWPEALQALVNIQSTDRLRGDEILVLGHIDFTEEMDRAEQLDPGKEADLDCLRKIVTEIDEQVFDILLQIITAGKIPLLMGGGHNNSYPALQALSAFHEGSVNCINIDAHADFRALEGRHSGNGFSYALRNGFLNRYAVLGLHENYNPQSVINELLSLKKQVLFSFLDDYLREHTSFDRAFREALNFTHGNRGLEIDMDSISGALSSAASPSGFTLEQVREMISMTKNQKFSYLHIAEAAFKMADGRENKLCGKAIAFLVSDFIKAQA